MDRRNYKTEKAFTEALFHFLKEKNFNKITVRELCEYADMNRGTFYLHYLDIYDLMDKTEQKMLDEIFDDESGEYRSLPTYVLKTFEYIKSHKDIFKMMLTGYNINGFVNKLGKRLSERTTHVLPKVVKNYDEKIAENVILFYVGGAASLIYGWVVDNDCEIPAETLMQTVGYVADVLLVYREEKQ